MPASVPSSPEFAARHAVLRAGWEKHSERLMYVRNRRHHLPGRAARHRRGHDPDAAVDEAPRPRLHRLRALRLAHQRRRRHAVQAGGPERPPGLRLGAAGAQPARGRAPAGRDRRHGRGGRVRDRVRLPRPAPLQRRPQAAGRLRRGRARLRGALAGLDRSRSSRTWATPSPCPTSTSWAASAARTRSATPAWPPSPTSTSRAPTPTGPTRSPTSPSCTTAS